MGVGGEVGGVRTLSDFAVFQVDSHTLGGAGEGHT